MRSIPKQVVHLAAALFVACLGLGWQCSAAQSTNAGRPHDVRVISDASGSKLQVDGRDLMVFGMNWGYIPIGENYLYDLWRQPDDMIEAALAREMPLLRSMGVNVIRLYAGIPPRWVQYIYEQYGIYTVLNHTMARYGFTLDGVWIPSVDYSDPRLRAAVKEEILQLVDQFRGTPGLLMWLLGNENNYGLTWTSSEIEALPEGERNPARARHLYSLFGEITRAIKERDPRRLVAISNGDLQYIDIIAQECRDIDVFGSNVYRGISARDFFQVVRDKLGVPTFFTEFGADAWNAKEMREDQATQARYLIGQWKEIYEQSYGKGRVGNAIGGFVFQWSDGWWKFGQESRLDVHDTNASWPNAGYPEDYVEGDNNMNEEWWGICAKGPPDARGLFDLYPRAAYYALRKAFQLDPYAPTTNLDAIAMHFAKISPAAALLEARGDHASLASETRARISGVRLEFETYSTGGNNISTPPIEMPSTDVPAFRGFDHLESFYVDVEARPSENVTGSLSVNILGHVPLNPIDEIFYENRGRPVTQVEVEEGTDPIREQDLQARRVEDLERIKVYRASVSWDDRWFQLNGFYRTGHTHWGYEGDFFGIYRDAYYGENVDIYNGIAPTGVEIAGKKVFQGLKVAFGRELYWGANPAVIVKARRDLGPITATALYQDEFAQQTTVTSSFAIPVPATRRATLHLEASRGPLGVELGGIWAGSTKEGESFQRVEGTPGDYDIRQDVIQDSDAFGVKGKLTLQRGRWNWYAQAARMGLVSDGGPTATITYTGWHLKDSGSSNQTNVLTGLAVNYGKFQIAPNFLWQKPIVGPIPGDVPSPGRPRNVIDDPFAVRANRETIGAEILLSYDPEPATWLWAWDNDVREGARFAGSVGYVYRDLRTTMDAAIGILADGRTTFAFPGATPPRELHEVHARTVSRLAANARLVTHLFGGTGEPNGDDTRLVERYGGDARLTWGALGFETFAKFNDWGPYDYHRDFNLTFPVQLMADLSYSLGTPRWFGFPQTRFGIRTTWRTLDRHSPRYCPVQVPGPAGEPECDPDAPGFDDGREWEIRTYLHVSM